MERLGKIFIQIASYRDPELVLTIQSLLAGALRPENLVFSITHQCGPDHLDQLKDYVNDPRFKILTVPYKESLGACWARNLLQQQYSGEEWTLQLDSHMRFAEGWDETLITMWHNLYSQGVAKPLITSYVPAYKPDGDPRGRVQTPWGMVFDHFTPEGVALFKPHYLPAAEQSRPWKHWFYSAHFAFAKGNFVKEVPHDPDLYFHGEEVSIAARAYTWGYESFAPHVLVAWHEYTRQGRHKVWDDDRDWWQRDLASKKRYRYLMEIDKPLNPIDWQLWGWGPYRTLAEYESASGLDFKKMSYTGR